MAIGYDQPLYLMPFDHRESLQTKMFGWHGTLGAAQTAEIAAAKQVIYDGFLAAVAGGVAKEHAGILVDDKLRILDAVKKAWGPRLTTVFPRQGHYARDPKALATYPPADVTIDHIGDLLRYDLPALLSAARPAASGRN